MQQFTIINPKPNKKTGKHDAYNIEEEDLEAARHWIINYLDLSIDWRIMPCGEVCKFEIKKK